MLFNVSLYLNYLSICFTEFLTSNKEAIIKSPVNIAMNTKFPEFRKHTRTKFLTNKTRTHNRLHVRKTRSVPNTLEIQIQDDMKMEGLVIGFPYSPGTQNFA